MRYIRTVGRRDAQVLYMTTFHDVPTNLLLPVLAERMESHDSISRPEWALHVKTGVHRERPPTQDNWWEIRSAAVLRKVAIHSPIGVNHLSQMFGGARDRGSAPSRAKSGSRHITRTVLQQLEQAGLVETKKNTAGTITLGRVLTPAGHKLINEVAHEVRPAAEETAPGLSKY